MKDKNQLITISGMRALAWVLPLPTWPTLKIGTQAQHRTYTLSNQSQEVIRITGISFEVADDDRLGFSGGTAHAGFMLAPQTTCTVEIQVNPKRLGPGKQILQIHHSGNFSPLWTEVLFNVASKGDVRRTTYLAEDTVALDRQRRLLEQEGHRHYARVNAREHPEQSTEQNLALEGGVQNNILQNPWLNSQRFDGIDPNLNPEPPLNTEARREFDNERRDQEMEKQLRLGNVPRVSPAPKPQGF